MEKGEKGKRKDEGNSKFRENKDIPLVSNFQCSES